MIQYVFNILTGSPFCSGCRHILHCLHIWRDRLHHTSIIYSQKTQSQLGENLKSHIKMKLNNMLQNEQCAAKAIKNNQNPSGRRWCHCMTHVVLKKSVRYFFLFFFFRRKDNKHKSINTHEMYQNQHWRGYL